MKKDKKGYSGTVTVWQLIKNILSWTFFSLLLIIALLLVYYVFANFRYSKKGEGYEPAFSMFTIISPSMQPNINVYDVIVDFPVKDASTLQVGDIITFVSQSSISKGMTVTHRITQIQQINGEYEFTTQGDNNVTPDSSRVNEKDIMGKVKLRIPQLGRLQYFLSSRGGWLLLILVPAVIILIIDIRKLFKMMGVKKKIDQINKQEPEIDEETKKKLIDHKNDLLKKYQNNDTIDLDDIEMDLPKLKN